jgi:glycosyl hydrolase group 75 (putative chitosanase)
MRYSTIFAAAAVLFYSSVPAQSQQDSKAAFPSQTASLNPTDSAGQCDRQPHAVQATERSEPLAQVLPDPPGETPPAGAPAAAVHLDEDLKLLTEKQSALAQCILAFDPQAPGQDSRGACFSELLLNFEMRHDGDPERDVPIGRLAGSAAFFYESGMTIDADGAPNAYHPDNSGLDDLANAGTPGRWEGLAKDPYGEPYIQGPDDPYPGYYVSATALADRSKPPNDPTRYVDASKIPFVVLPGGMARELGARPGDFAAVFNQRNRKSSYAIFGDVGPYDRIGEGSMALAENLGIRSDARNGGARGGILFLVFPGSGNGRPRTIEEINAEGQRLLEAWEDSVAPVTCADEQPARAPGGQPGN